MLKIRPHSSNAWESFLSHSDDLFCCKKVWLEGISSHQQQAATGSRARNSTEELWDATAPVKGRLRRVKLVWFGWIRQVFPKSQLPGTLKQHQNDLTPCKGLGLGLPALSGFIPGPVKVQELPLLPSIPRGTDASALSCQVIFLWVMQ